MNDLEVQRKDEIIEVQTPIIEPIKTKEYKPNYILSLLHKITYYCVNFINSISTIYTVFWGFSIIGAVWDSY